MEIKVLRDPSSLPVNSGSPLFRPPPLNLSPPMKVACKFGGEVGGIGEPNFTRTELGIRRETLKK